MIISQVVAFIAIFAIVFLLVKILHKILSDLERGLKLESLGKVLGLLVGFGKGVLLSAIVIFVMVEQPIFDQQSIVPLLRSSFIAQTLQPFMPSLQDLLSSEIMLSPLNL